ncbi:hypothetical protein OHC33_011139 [Knufia fluminis]|uniref:Uncharacterized protein n=2 Tax=Knufia TaxID=430999 RepID=A0AAN8EC72_9EURO|nr:hypothetical protein OHC33_011139 [Knufia fluminis]
MPLPFEKSGRDLERDLLRRARGYTQKIQSTTSTIVRKPIASGTQNHYENMLREWDNFIDEYEGVPDPTNVKTAKDFVLYFSTGRKGRNEANGPLTVSYTYAAWKWFMAAWSRKHYISFVKSHQDTVKNFIEGGEASSAPTLSRKTRPRRNFTLEDFDQCVKQLWQNDWHDYIHERYRVGLQLLLLLHCNTSGRRGEYEKELTYANITIALVWLKDKDQPQIIIDFRRTKAKGLQNFEREQPQHMLYELVDLPFYFNSVAFFMAAVLADGVLRDYHTWDAICAIPKPTQRKHIILEYDPEKGQWPVFPRSLRTGCIDHTRPSTSLTSNALLYLGFRTGFRENLTLHAARREALLKVDNFGYSCDQRMRFAGHTNPHTYRRSYQPSMSMVDGQATFFDYEPNNDELHQLHRGYSWARNPCHQPNLPEATRTRLQEKMWDEADSDGQELPQDSKERQKGYDHWRQQ